MEFSPLISFHAISASIQMGAGFPDAPQRSISLSLKLDEDEDIETADGHSLRKLEWSLTLVEGIYNKNFLEEEAVGLLSYYDNSHEIIVTASCHAGVGLPPPVFVELWSLVSYGQLPSTVTLSVRGLSFGCDPDGGEKVWDVVKKPQAYITDTSFRFYPIPKSSIPYKNQDYSNADSPSLLQAIERFHLLFAKKIQYVLAALIFIIIFLVFK